jgi:uncharacterized protein (DUF1015 family)
MAIIKPFRAWRPKPDKVQEVACVPYDVIDSDEAAELAHEKPLSFLHVIRPEIDLSKDTDIHAPEVYEKGKDNLDSLLESDSFAQELDDSLYVYRLSWKGQTQTGIFGCVSVKDYDHEVILKHELTRPDKEDDRTRHILTQQAHAEPVMMTFEDTSGISELMDEVTHHASLYDFKADDVQHSIWKVDAPQALILAFTDIPNIYIADGHHRCASASRAAHEMESQNPEHSGKEEYNFFPAVLFPRKEMNILSYNRIIFELPDDFLDKLSDNFELTTSANPIPERKGDISIFIDNEWVGITLPESSKNDATSQLDVARLQEYILDPFLGITDQRTDSNISFVGGKRGTKELERLVTNGKAALAISMYPTSIKELIDVSDAGLLMPPKSTWFEPKLRSGLLIHTF